METQISFYDCKNKLYVTEITEYNIYVGIDRIIFRGKEYRIHPAIMDRDKGLVLIKASRITED